MNGCAVSLEILRAGVVSCARRAARKGVKTSRSLTAKTRSTTSATSWFARNATIEKRSCSTLCGTSTFQIEREEEQKRLRVYAHLGAQAEDQTRSRPRKSPMKFHRWRLRATSQLLPRATITSNANAVANRVAGIVKGVNLTTYSTYLSSMHRSNKDFSVSPDRQVYVIDVALPNGINSHGGAFGPNAEMHYVVDAISGKYISSLISGSRTGRNIHAR